MNNDANEGKNQKVGQEQIHGLLFSEKLSWQAIIYDLINTEQLDPWDIDICLLSNKYLERVREIEEANFFVSSKVLFAASLLLRIKSEILLNRDLPSLDDILFGRTEEKKYVQERIEFDDEIPELIPRTPLPRTRKVTLQELMSALGKAIKTETRRIKRVIVDKQRAMDTAFVLPKKNINLREQISEVYKKLRNIISGNGGEKVAFSDLSGENSDEKVSHFIPLLHLDYQHKVYAEQEKPFDEIWVWLKEKYMEKHSDMLEQMRIEAEEAMKEDVIELAKESEIEKLEKLKKLVKKRGKKKKVLGDGGEDDLEKAELDELERVDKERLNNLESGKFDNLKTEKLDSLESGEFDEDGDGTE